MLKVSSTVYNPTGSQRSLHRIVTAVLDQGHNLYKPAENFTIKLYEKASLESFHGEMQQTHDKLAHLSDPEEMWNLFTADLSTNSIKKKYVPTKELKTNCYRLSH